MTKPFPEPVPSELAAINVDFALLSLKTVCVLSGIPKSTLYLLIRQSLWTEPVRCGPRFARWPAREVRALNEARIAGSSPAEIQKLVQELVAGRQKGRPLGSSLAPRHAGSSNGVRPLVSAGPPGGDAVTAQPESGR